MRLLFSGVLLLLVNLCFGQRDSSVGKKVYINEKMPEFVGGEDALFKYLSSSVKYPAKPIKLKVKGTVEVSFIINSEGKVDSVEIRKGIDPYALFSEKKYLKKKEEIDLAIIDLQNEAIRVIREMPNWIPGYQDYKPVNVYFSIPLTFSL